MMTAPTPPVRIQKCLAQAGLGSRRQVETWLAAGRISVNGRVAQLGDRISGRERVMLDGRTLRLSASSKQRTRVLIYHKPEGELCTRSDPEKRPTIFRSLPKLQQGRWVSVGRLDFNSAGLLLLTNDGEMANDLMHPRSEIEREYAVRVRGQVSSDVIKRLRDGVTLEDGLAHFDAVEFAGGRGSNRWFHVIVKAGRNRLVRRLWESQGVTVSRLIRVRYGPITLGRRLRPGEWRDLRPGEMKQLKENLACQKQKS